jgi:hypothetical protein
LEAGFSSLGNVQKSLAWRQAGKTATARLSLEAAIENIREETWKPGQTN